MMKETPEQVLGYNSFEVDEEEAHIVLNKEICASCQDKPCVKVCPAGLYTIKNGEVNFDYAGCLECGTCRLVCTKKGIQSWQYPRGTFGIAFRCG